MVQHSTVFGEVPTYNKRNPCQAAGSFVLHVLRLDRYQQAPVISATTKHEANC